MQFTIFDKAIAAFLGACAGKAILAINARYGINLPQPSPEFTDWLNTAIDTAVEGGAAALFAYFAKNKTV